ncbi:hypothetical protein QTI51_09560 [Variovorax sp. J22G73]|uniref:capsid assembly protein n=1 Tax=unclassified Variovorax TaxID=663243 RepID=UPI002575CD49|nr:MULTISPECIES: hypothetical protein [unclassified Variovorax]MDM0006454.1 hypothetical protein [Variovorax sp. J22R203]MDM0097523.1 hypothetical protein [Variovorax sp. J22G73]
MIAAYDAQFKAPTPAATQSQTAAQPAQAAAAVDPNAQAPRLTDVPADTAKPTDPPKPEGQGEVKSLAALIDSGDLFKGLGGEKVPDDLITDLKAMGLTDAQVAGLNTRMAALLKAEATLQTQNLQKAAGGADEFNKLVAWGQKNLSAEQREFYDAQLNGPNAADAIAVLKARMNAGADPALVNVNGKAAPAVAGFRDKTEMVAAMQDPRYQTSEAYRADVAAKLKASRF